MAQVKVNYDTWGGVSRYADPDDEWDRDDTWAEHSVRSVTQVGDKDYYDLSTEFELDPSRNYHLVHAVYSTGDSFGHDEGQLEFIGLYSDLEVAKENVRRLEAHNDLYEKLNRRSYYGVSKKEQAELKKLEKTFEPYTVRLVLEDGREYDVHVPWHGYFENLTSVNLNTVVVE